MKNETNAAVQVYNIGHAHHDCLGCGKSIINPLCPRCLANQFIEWLKDHRELTKETSHKLNSYIKRAQKDLGESCALCGEKVHTCVYCFTEYLYEIIKEAGAGPKILSEFLFMFNYDFKRIGYSHEFEALGGY